MAFEPGQRVGDYEIVAKLGAGGLGVVYEVQHLISQRREAMKIMLPDQTGASEMVERFRREVQTLATLNHVNIAQLHTAFYYENQLAMVMELVHGETLRDLRARSAITLAQALEYVSQVLTALVYAHRLGVIHRDIKPSNVMITDGGFVKLLDFGIALNEHDASLTRAGYLLGSLNYMSPEQVSGSKATPRSDLYSVGVTLYELLTGVLPITGSNNYEIMMAHISQVPTPPHQVSQLVPAAVSDAVMRALAKDPNQRYASAEEFLHALKLTPATSEEGLTYAAPLPMSPAGSSPPPPPAPVAPAASAPPMPPVPPQSPPAVSAPRPAAFNTSPPAPETSGTPVATRSVQQRTPSFSGLESLPLEEISRKLAVYIGPVAKFVVKKLAARSSDLDFIYREAAKEIPSDSDRAAFLKARRR